jgi:hypothetical protein
MVRGPYPQFPVCPKGITPGEEEDEAATPTKDRIKVTKMMRIEEKEGKKWRLIYKSGWLNSPGVMEYLVWMGDSSGFQAPVAISPFCMGTSETLNLFFCLSRALWF